MNFNIKKSEIVNVLSKIQGLTSRKSSLNITTSVLIQSYESGVKLFATDLETGFEGTYSAEVSEEGKIALNAKKLYEIIRDFPSEDILINEVENHWIEISNQTVEYRIVGMDPEDFPLFPQIENIPFFSIESRALKRMIENTVIVTAPGDEKRIHILGIYFEIINNADERMVRLVSTDGNRLAKADFKLDEKNELPEEKGFIIPKKGLTELNKLIDSDKTVEIGFKDNHFILKKERETSIIRLLEGEYPKYREILNVKGQGNIVKMNKEQFSWMLRRMSILSSEDYKGVIFNFYQDRLLINSTNPEIGESKEDMIINFKGDKMEAVFNPKYFIDSLNCIEEETVELNIISEESPCFIEGEKDKSYLCVIMPMRV